MPSKRKQSAAAPEEPEPKRVLRSGRETSIATPTRSPTKRSVASRRVKSPQKHVEKLKQNNAVISEHSPEDVESEDELNFISTEHNQARLPPCALSDETNTICISSPIVANNVKDLESSVPKKRRGRPSEEIASIAEEPPVSGDVRSRPDPKMKSSSKSAKVSTPIAPSRTRQTRSTPIVEIPILASPKWSAKRLPSSRANAKQSSESTISGHEMPSSSKDGVPLAHNIFAAEFNADVAPKKVSNPSTTREKAKTSPQKSVAAEELFDATEEQEISEIVMPSPRKRKTRSDINNSTDPSGPLPEHLQPCFNAYRRAILKDLQCPGLALVAPAEDSVNSVANTQLADLIDGTVLRAEGNSCLLLGPRGSGKSQMVDACLEKVSAQKPIILRLSGWVQNTDRHALREIAFQLLQQTGSSLLPDSEKDEANIDTPEGEEENPFLDRVDHSSGETTLSLPPSSHLHALIPVLLTLSRPVIVVLDAFDLFALHPRQSLLYCLLDTVQNCRASSGSRGIAVIGITSRVDTTQLLEKRVKSRFSGRTIRTAPPNNLETCLSMVRAILQPCDVCDGDEDEEEWSELWAASVERFFADKNVINVLNDTFGITRDYRVVGRILTSCLIRLTSSQPYLSFKVLSSSIDSQSSRPRATDLHSLSYPALCLLIASAHADTSGHQSFTFNMIFESFRDQVRALAAAPVQVNGGTIGMMRCTREVLMGAFEELISVKIFVCVTAPSTTIGRQFIKYRCSIDRPDVTTIVNKAGNTNLKKWFTKNQ